MKRAPVVYRIFLLTLIAACPLGATTLDLADVTSVNSLPAAEARPGERVVAFALAIANGGADDAIVTGVDLDLAATWSGSIDPNIGFTTVSAYVDGDAAGPESGNSSFSSDGIADDLLGFVVTGAVPFFGSSSPETSVVNLAFSANQLELPAGETKTLYVVIAATSDGSDHHRAAARSLAFQLTLADEADVTLADAGDTVNPSAPMSGLAMGYDGAAAGSGGGNDKVIADSGCTLCRYDGGRTSSWLRTALMSLALLVMIARRRYRLRR